GDSHRNRDFALGSQGAYVFNQGLHSEIRMRTEAELHTSPSDESVIGYFYVHLHLLSWDDKRSNVDYGWFYHNYGRRNIGFKADLDIDVKTLRNFDRLDGPDVTDSFPREKHLALVQNPRLNEHGVLVAGVVGRAHFQGVG